MAEQYPSDVTLNGLAGTTIGSGVPLPEILQKPAYTAMLKYLWRMATSLAALDGLEVYKDAALTFGVRAGRFMDGSTARNYAGASAQALTNNQTNYIYLTAGATLTVNITGFPDPDATPHVPLATILTAGGTYDFDDITDYRGRALLQLLDGLGPAERQDLMPNLYITAAAESGDDRQITFQARDAGNNNLAQRVLVRLWIATSDYGAPSAAGNTVALDTGTIIETVTANAYYLIESDAAGKVQVTVTVAGAASRYILAEIDGRVYSSGQVDWTA